MKMIPILYIAGYGRSGSTLLEGLLGLHPLVFPMGESSRFWEMSRDNSILCSCGESIRRCEFWGPVSRSVLPAPTEIRRILRLVRSVEGSRIKGPSANRQDLRDYRELMDGFFRAVLEQVGEKTWFLVDSSKTAYGHANRPTVFHRHLGLDVRVIHLVRDIRGVACSMKKGLNRNLERRDERERKILNFFRGIVGWTYANMRAAELRKILPKGKYLLVRYEDFVLSTPTALKSIFDFMEIEAGWESLLDASVEGDTTRHQLAGNRNRFHSKVVVRPDFKWQEELSSIEKRLALGLTRPLVKRLGIGS